MSDHDLINHDEELGGLRDSLSGMPIPDPPRLETILARGQARRQQRLARAARFSVGGVVAATALAVGLISSTSAPPRFATIHTAAYTLRHNHNGTDTLTLQPVELLDPSQLQSDFAQYGIPAKVTSGSYCTSDPAPAGFSQAVSSPGPGTSQAGSGQDPSVTIDPSQIPSGTELSVGTFQDTAGPTAGEEQANMSLISASSYTCSTTPPDMSKPDTSNQDIGVLYGGHGRSGS